MAIYEWCEELIVASDHAEARRVLLDQFTPSEVRQFEIKRISGPVTLCNSEGEEYEVDADAVPGEPRIIPEWNG